MPMALGYVCALPLKFSRGGGVFSCMVAGYRHGGSGPALLLSSLYQLIIGFRDAADACGGRTS